MEEFLRCPCESHKRLCDFGSEYCCSEQSCPHSQRGHGFKLVSEIPVLLSSKTNSVFSAEKYESHEYVDRERSRFFSLAKKIFYFLNEYRAKNRIKRALSFIDVLSPRILIIGGGEVGAGVQYIYQQNLSPVVLDVYISPNVAYVADAHYLPFSDACFDLVICQAVLEHVIEPSLVVSEINRVLDSSGIVYAETPFMQQVHEGAYDFNRYTILGHRKLFSRFRLIEQGAISGAFTVLAWDIKYLLWALFRNKFLAQILSSPFLLFSPYLDLILQGKYLFDNSGGNYFIGRKHEKRISDVEIIDSYRGAYEKNK